MFKNIFLAFNRDSFYKTAMFIYEHKKNDFNFRMPLIVNEAFTCELSIKIILKQSNIDCPKTHSLFDLFKLLPSEKQHFVFNNIHSNLNYPLNIIEDELKRFTFAFQDCRYLGDTHLAINITLLHSFMCILYNISKAYLNVALKEKTANQNEHSELNNHFIDLENQVLENNEKKLNKQKKRELNCSLFFIL